MRDFVHTPQRAAPPPRAGVSFKPQHARDALERSHDIGWFEVHAENYMGAGGPPHRILTALRERFPLSIHGVGLSIGGEGPLDRDHLARLSALLDRYAPALFSEHLAWSTHEGVYFNDLLPLPYTSATLARVVDHLDAAQTALGRTILLENPSTYAVFAESEMSETDFLRAVADRSGCGLLLDVNNIFVSATNLGLDPLAYVDAFPLDRVGEIHLGGHAPDPEAKADADAFLIDTHDRPVADPVWALFAEVVARTGVLPTLVEWDADLPDFAVLEAEAARADRVLAACGASPDAS